MEAVHPRPAASASAPGSDRQVADGLADGTVIGDHFVIRRKLGGGGMGEVYLAENLNVAGKKYAIKILRREFSRDARFIEMLHDEAAKQARLDHDNVVGMYDFFSWSGHYCLLQAFAPGKTLAQILEEHGQGLPLHEALTLMRGVLRGLDFAHAHGILHCDMKPANVIVDPDGRPRVTDFGISRDLGTAARRTALRGAGTVGYMSAEQAWPPYDIDHRSDVFSSGVVLFQMLSGRMPFDTGPNGDILPPRDAQAPDVRSVRADLPEPVARIVATALQRDREQRFQGCGDFERAIVAYEKRVRWNKTWRPALIALAAIPAVTLGGLYEWREHLVEVATRDRIANDAARAANVAAARVLAERKERAIDETLHNAAAAMNLVCLESNEYTIKKRGVDDAVGSGLTQMADLFRDKLSSLQTGIDKQAQAYASALSRLQQEDAALVAQGLARQAKADTLVAAFVDTIRADDASLRAAGTMPSSARMAEQCPAPPSVPAR